jgi:hypothetical protein
VIGTRAVYPSGAVAVVVEVPRAMLDDRDLRNLIVYSCIVGSRAYGLDHADSDVDRRGVYLPPAARHWSLGCVPEQLEDQGARGVQPRARDALHSTAAHRHRNPA